MFSNVPIVNGNCVIHIFGSHNLIGPPLFFRCSFHHKEKESFDNFRKMECAFDEVLQKLFAICLPFNSFRWTNEDARIIVHYQIAILDQLLKRFCFDQESITKYMYQLTQCCFLFRQVTSQELFWGQIFKIPVLSRCIGVRSV